ncbi:uncharacterized protein DEA37_0005872, partial [Paragonimus westermani]
STRFLLQTLEQPSFTLATVITQRIGRLLLIGLNRPDKANSLDRFTANLLGRVVTEQLEHDKDVYGGVIYGEGTDFCTGLDFDELSTSSEYCLKEHASMNNFAPMGFTRMCLSKPLVAAITGRAIGGGLELAMACDLRVAEEDSILGLHPRKYCIPMMDMGTARLPALIGLSRALDLVLTGRSLTAPEAYQFGLVNRVAKVGTAVGIAVNLVDTMCQLPGQTAFSADRDGVLRASDFVYRLAAEEFERAHRAFLADSHAGLRIFFEERLKSDRRRP